MHAQAPVTLKQLDRRGELVVCVYVHVSYTYVHTYVSTCIYTHKHTHVRTYVHTYIHTYIHIHAYFYMFLLVCVFVCLFVCLFSSICLCLIALSWDEWPGRLRHDRAMQDLVNQCRRIRQGLVARTSPADDYGLGRSAASTRN